MKKNILLMAAVSALLLTACTSEDDILQTGPTKKATTQEVGFDVYIPAVTQTRSGQAGTMTTGRLQREEAKGGGFGVYAYLTEDADKLGTKDHATAYGGRTTAVQPNFMVNEKVLWNATNQGWYYNPLKYWPNETDNDSQTTPAYMENATDPIHMDRLTFFAYAPYVETGANESGITHLTNKKGRLNADPTSDDTSTSLVEASIGYKASLDNPEGAVDLLWGVAPAGGLSYTAVNGTTVTVPQGEPLIDMTKPDVNTNMKFLFQHALARIGINVVAAVDQVSPGGTMNSSETKITIKEVTLKGMFGETGILNLDNPTANVANWTKINGTDIDNNTKKINETGTLTLSADKGTIAPWLRYKGEHTFGSYSKQDVKGVTTSKQDLITPRYFQLDAIPEYSPTKQYYTTPKAMYTVKSTDKIYIKSDGDNYTYTKQAANTKLEAPESSETHTKYYLLTESGPIPNSNASSAVDLGAAYFTKSGETYTYAGLGSTLTWDVDWGSVEESAKINYYTLSIYEYKVSDLEFDYYNKATAKYAVTATDNIYTLNAGGYYVKEPVGVLSAPEIGTSTSPYYKLEQDGDAIDNNIADPGPGSKYYTKDGDGIFTYVESPTWVGTENAKTATYYKVTAKSRALTDIGFKYEEDPIYDVERNYFMVVPTNRVALNTGLSEDEEKALRTVRVMIKYYITTEDGKVKGGRTQTENIIEKDVLFPSLANGKSYNLNLVLGLTSVKMEAEVDDWKVINVQADLPQNTAE